MKKQSQTEFMRRCRAAIDSTIAAGDGVPAEAVIAKLEDKLAAARAGNVSDADAAVEKMCSYMQQRKCVATGSISEVGTRATQGSSVLIFIDTEFTSLKNSSKLISIGLVEECGQKTFYCELTDTWQLNDTNDIVRREVLPKLEGGPAQMTKSELRGALDIWLAGFNESVQLATDSLNWDWVWIHSIFGGQLPANVLPSPLLLTMNYLVNFDSFRPAIEAAFAAGLRRHHALDDAKANRLGWIAAGGHET